MFSILLCVYNGEEVLNRCLRSLHTQTFQDFEVIVVNDGSTDETASILDNWLNILDLKIINNGANIGLTKSLNLAIDRARYEYVVRQDADDISYPRRLENLKNLISSKSWVSSPTIFYTRFTRGRNISELKEPLISKCYSLISGLIPRILRTQNCLVHGSIAVRRSDLIEIGKYDHAMRYSQDYELYLRALSKGFNFVLINSVDYGLTLSQTSLSSKHRSEQRNFAMQARRKNIDG